MAGTKNDKIIEKRFVHFKNYSTFLKEINNEVDYVEDKLIYGNLKRSSIVWISDLLLIWTHGRFYPLFNMHSIDDLTLPTDLNLKEGDKLLMALAKLLQRSKNIEKYLQDEMVTITTPQTITGAKTFTSLLTLGTRGAGLPSSTVDKNLLCLHPISHTGGPWYINTQDTTTTAYLRVLYGSLPKLILSTTGELTATTFVKSGGTARQVLMADGSVQSHYKAVDITTATSDDGMITPLAMNNWVTKNFVSALGTSGNYVTWTKNGVVNNITVPYSTSTSRVITNGVTTAISNTKHGTGIRLYEAYNNGYPITYGNIISVQGANSGAGELLLGWSGSDAGYAGLYYRNCRDMSNTWSPWVTIVDSSNCDSVIGSKLTAFVKKAGDTMSGALGVLGMRFEHTNEINANGSGRVCLGYRNTPDGINLCYQNTPLTYGSAASTIWHAGNDGHGSGLDADLLDGKHASEFAASSHTHDDRYYTESEINTKLAGYVTVNNDQTVNGTKTFSNSIKTNNISSIDGNGLIAYSGSWTGVDFTTLWAAGALNGLGVIRSNGSNLLHYKNNTLTSVPILDTSNYTSYITTVRDRTNGTATYLNYGAAGLTTASWLAAWNSYELRAISPATVLSVIGALPASSYTASDILAKIKTVDGSGSGLDADTVDGVHNGGLMAAYLNFIGSVSDFNNVAHYNGIYKWNTDIPNMPHAYGAMFQWSNVSNPTPGTNQHWITLLASSTNNRLYYRTITNNSEWEPWRTIAFTSDLSNYLPLSGGTVNGVVNFVSTTRNVVNIKGATDGNYITFGDNKGYVGLSSTGMFIQNGTTNNIVYLSDNGSFKYRDNGTEYNILHTGNYTAYSRRLVNYYYDTNRPTSANINFGNRSGLYTFLATSSMTTGKPAGDGHILHMEWDNGDCWAGLLTVPNSGSMLWRNLITSGWQAWRTIIDSSNISSYALTALDFTTSATSTATRFIVNATKSGSTIKFQSRPMEDIYEYVPRVLYSAVGAFTTSGFAPMANSLAGAITITFSKPDTNTVRLTMGSNYAAKLLRCVVTPCSYAGLSAGLLNRTYAVLFKTAEGAYADTGDTLVKIIDIVSLQNGSLITPAGFVHIHIELLPSTLK